MTKSRMSPPHSGHSSGNSSPTRAISFAHVILEVSCEWGLAPEWQQSPVARSSPACPPVAASRRWSLGGQNPNLRTGVIHGGRSVCIARCSLPRSPAKSPSQVQAISRLFRQHHGLSFQAYLQRLRLEKAAELLRATRLPIARIAKRAGYRDASRFGQQFKRMSEATPFEYRTAEQRG